MSMTESAQDAGPRCRFCTAPLRHTFVDLGMSPLCESYLDAGQLNRMEPFFPLHVRVCAGCFLVQLEEYVQAEDIFTEYAYFSSYSRSWLEHAQAYAEAMIPQLGLGEDSLVVELASNDGYLLQYFVRHGVPVLGVEPAANIAPAAEALGVPTLVEFFDDRLAGRLVTEGRSADLVVANNVLAQVPQLNAFVRGIRLLLKPQGVATIEVPHLQRLVEENQFDTIYHEHFSYFSLLTLVEIFASHGMEVYDVEELWTHGGSLRVFIHRADDDTRQVQPAVGALLDRERTLGYDRVETYEGFEQQVRHTKNALLAFLIEAKEQGRTVVGYGAPGKGNTLLNYCGIRQDYLDYTVDRNPYKQGKYLPGTHIPIREPDRIFETRPDYVLILPWNFKDEIVQQMAGIHSWGGRFVVPIPEVQVLDAPVMTR
jgi:SAM-dependent methyltransferase